LFEKFEQTSSIKREPIPDDVKGFVWRRDQGRCVQCGNNEKLKPDHVIPVAKGGSNTERNIQLLCESCNRAKGASIRVPATRRERAEDAEHPMSRKREHERALFTAFLDLEPAFAGERLADWQQPKNESDFPDIVATSVTGRRVGVELGEWLNEDEIQAAKGKERLEEALLNAIGDQGPNPTQHIRYAWLHPKARIASADVAGFRDQLFACILKCDRRWPDERFWKVGHRLVDDELAEYPLLAKYLNAIKLWPADGEQWKEKWITFPLRAGFFDRETMFKPLRELVAEKIGHYGTTRTGFDDLSLLIIYNQTAIYNSPPETPFHDFDDAVVELREIIGDNRGPFDRVFLYLALEPGRVLRVSRCLGTG
jgi:hypothetical protein